MTDLEMKHYLNRAFYADKKALALRMLTEQLRERAEGLSKSGEYTDTSPQKGSQNAAEGAVMRLLEMQERYEVQLAQLVKITDEVSDTISRLNDNDLEAVLIHRYILFHTIEETAELMHYAPRTVRAKQKAAIEKLCLLMPCFAASDVVD